MKDLEIGVLNELYGSLLTEKQSDIIRSYYDYDLSLAEIAEQYGITRQAAHDAVRKGEHALSAAEEKMGFMAKLRDLESGLHELIAVLKIGDARRSEEIAEELLQKL